MQTISPPGSVSVIALMTLIHLLEIVRSVLDFTVWTNIRMTAVGMLDVPVEVVEIRE